MCINHCCLKTRMPKQVLNRPNILSFFQQMSGKAMPQRVNRNPFGYFRLFCSPFYLFLEIARMNVVSSNNSCSWSKGNLKGKTIYLLQILCRFIRFVSILRTIHIEESLVLFSFYLLTYLFIYLFIYCFGSLINIFQLYNGNFLS